MASCVRFVRVVPTGERFSPANRAHRDRAAHESTRRRDVYRRAICLCPDAHHIKIMSTSYESLRAELDEIVEQYRTPVPRDGSKGRLTLEEAVERIHKLGFTRGDAIRWLGQKRRR